MMILKLSKFRIVSTILMVLMVFTSFISASQNVKKIDSLERRLDENISDLERLEILKELSYKASSPSATLEYAQLLISESEKLSEERYLALGYISQGIAYRKLGDLQKSLDSHFKAAEISELNRHSKVLGMSYIEIATVYSQNEDIRNSLVYKSKAIALLRSDGNQQQLAITLLNTGFSYYTANNLDTALSYYNEAEPIFEEIGLTIGTAYTIGNRALVYWKLGNHDDAIAGLFKAIEMLEPLGDQYGTADYYNQLGSIYLEQSNTNEAIKYTALGLKMAKEENLKEQVRNASKLLSELLSQRGDYREAFEYQRQYLAYKDSIQDDETTQRLADLRTEYEVGQKQAEVDLLSVEKRNQQLLSVGLSVILLLITLFALLTYRNYKEKNRINLLLEGQAQQLKVQKEELERLNATKDKFFSIISHDLRGPVATFMGVSQLIRFFVESKDTDQLIEIADEMEQSVSRLSALLDNLLNWAMQQQGHFPNVPEKLELKSLVKDVLGPFETMASSKSIQLSSNIEEDLSLWADNNMIQTILRNLVNNALKFTNEGGEVTVHAVSEENVAVVKVVDSGVGMPKKKLEELFGLSAKKSTYGTSGEKGLGLGLQLVNEFIETSGGELTVESEEGKGTTFTIRLPLFESGKVPA